MIEEDIDKLFKDNIQRYKSLPNDIKWKPEEGWQRYRKNYFRRKKVNFVIPYLAAIGTILLLILTILYIILIDKWIVYQSNNEIKEVAISPEIKVYLNDNSNIKYSKFYNQLNINGEVYFEINSSRDVIIKAGDTKMLTQKATLNLKEIKEENNFLVSVITGKIEVITVLEKQEKVPLHEGFQCVAGISGQKPEIMVIEDPNFLAWKTKKLVFNNTPLGIAKVVLMNYYKINIVSENQDLDNCSLTIELNNLNPEQAIDSISKKLKIYSIKSDNSFIFKSK